MWPISDISLAKNETMYSKLRKNDCELKDQPKIQKDISRHTRTQDYLPQILPEIGHAIQKKLKSNSKKLLTTQESSNKAREK